MKKIRINPKEDLIFDLKVTEACKSCKRYGTKATCSPYVGNIGYYRELLPSYKYGIIYYEKFDSNQKEWESIGKESSLVMHKQLLKKRDELFFKGHFFVTIFGSGSCKLCEKCSFPCRFPSKSIVPLEATGVNVVEIMKKFDIDIKFPVTKTIYRIGAIFYA